jgi:hypothetical protein
MLSRHFSFALFLLAALPVWGHEFPGHPTHDEAPFATIGSELYLGKRGYWHGGLGVAMPLGRSVTLEIGAHVVREERGAREVPSFEAELISHLAGGLELELFGFGYPEVEGRQAWGVGFRATKRFAFAHDIGIAPFFGPTFAHVRAEDATGKTIEPINHTLLLAGVTFDRGPLSATLIGSHSIYDRNPSGRETPVDLESMTHFPAYENNDGFARNTLAVEASWDVTAWLTLNARYAAMWFDDETRHAVTVAPAAKLGKHVEFTAGVQFLRGGEVENDLLFTGLSVSF